MQDPTQSFHELDRNVLFERFTPLIRRLVRQYGSTPDLAQDLPGELYCRFHALLDAYDPDRGVPLHPYLVRQLILSAYSVARTRWRQGRKEAPLLEGDNNHGLTTEVHPSDAWDTTMRRRDLLEALPGLIAELPERQHQVLVMRYYETRDFADIAQELGIQESSVRSLLRHAVNRLRQSTADLAP